MINNHIKNCALLNRAEPYFNMNPVKPTKTGKMKAMSSRNNNFSNRGQKLSLIVYSRTNIKDLDSNNKNSNTKKTQHTSSDGLTIGTILAIVTGCMGIVFIIVASIKI